MTCLLTRRSVMMIHLFWWASIFLIMSCDNSPDDPVWIEKQVTSGDYGHFINPVQAFSPDDEWIVYDTRNDGGKIGATGTIERVNILSGQQEVIYQTTDQTDYGPGVGAAAYAPHKDQVIFIHGIRNSDEHRPYDLSRRTGVGVMPDIPDSVIFYDARDVVPPFTAGALRGGTHAHSWSADGQWITFTYNDAIMDQLAQTDDEVEDLRMIGVIAPWTAVDVPSDSEGENNSGEYFTMIVSRVTENPAPGSDEISKAYEDGWIGRNGYLDESGERRRRSIAFLGDVRSAKGETVTEVFVVDLPEEMPDLTDEQQLKGTEITRPLPLSSVEQRRITFTEERKYPGVQGPRQWMKSTPDGSRLFFMMKDDDGIVQIFSVSPNGGEIHQVTKNDFSIETSFDIDPDGNWLAYGAGQKLYRTHIDTGKTECLLPEVDPDYSSLHSVQWSRNGKMLAYNRRVKTEDTTWYQIFTLTPADE